MSNMMRVMSKAFTRHGVKSPSAPTEYLVELEAGKSVKVFRERNGVIEEGTRFEIGSEAEYDSFNLSYLGSIESISEKTITIVKSRGVSAKKHRLSLYEFCWRNFKFNSEEVRERNRIESYNI